jgi:hypothetical protein
MSAPPDEPRHRPPATAAGGAEAAHRLWFAARVGFAALALWVAASEPWDADGDGRVSAREALLLGVRFLAFPLHLLLSLAPAPVLDALGLPPDAHWPSSAAAAVLLGLPLWGLALIGGLLAEAWLERASEARRARKGAI